jgi:hypothetical protein
MAAEHGPHVPPDRRTAATRMGDDLVIHGGKVAEKRVVLPFVAEEVAGEGHLGEEHERRPGLTRLIDATEDPGEVHLGVPRNHLHLTDDDGPGRGRGRRGRKEVGHRRAGRRFRSQNPTWAGLLIIATQDCQQPVAKVGFTGSGRALNGCHRLRLDRRETQEGAWHSGSDVGSGSWRPSSWPPTCRSPPVIRSTRH